MYFSKYKVLFVCDFAVEHTKKRNSIINIGKDQNYPYVSMKFKKKETHKKKQNKY